MKGFKWLKRQSFGNAHEQVPLIEEVILRAKIEITLHCRHCEKDIRKACEKTEGVESVNFDYEDATVMVKGRFGVKQVLKNLRRKAGKVGKVLELEKEGTQNQQNETPNEGGFQVQLYDHLNGPGTNASSTTNEGGYQIQPYDHIGGAGTDASSTTNEGGFQIQLYDDLGGSGADSSSTAKEGGFQIQLYDHLGGSGTDASSTALSVQEI